MLICVNALNGLLPFLLQQVKIEIEKDRCQRPKRASSISTLSVRLYQMQLMLCQRPKRASSISTKEWNGLYFYSSEVSTP